MGAWIEILIIRSVCLLLASHPTWVRGLKLEVKEITLSDMSVAPHVGVWIEILVYKCNGKKFKVAPHVGAWIEMPVSASHTSHSEVAPHVGAWIEIPQGVGENSLVESHPTWVRGLK